MDPRAGTAARARLVTQQSARRIARLRAFCRREPRAVDASLTQQTISAPTGKHGILRSISPV